MFKCVNLSEICINPVDIGTCRGRLLGLVESTLGTPQCGELVDTLCDLKWELAHTTYDIVEVREVLSNAVAAAGDTRLATDISLDLDDGDISVLIVSVFELL